MAKDKYTLFQHDDLDVSYFKELIGANELDALFLNAETFMPAVGILGIKDLIKSEMAQFSLTDDMQIICDYCERLFKLLTKKIKNNKHKEAVFQQAIEALIEHPFDDKNKGFDVSILYEIEAMQAGILCFSNDERKLDEPKFDKPPLNWQTVYAQTLGSQAKEISEKLIKLANAVYDSDGYTTMPGNATEFLAHVAMVMLLDIPRTMVNHWLANELYCEKLVNDAEKNARPIDADAFDNAVNFTMSSLAVPTTLSIEYGTFYEPVKICIFSSYYILKYIEDINPVGKRSQTLSPDRFLYQEQIERSFGSGSKHKLDNVSIYIRNITYKIWLYYWQHSQDKFKSSSKEEGDGPYVTAQEMIFALADAFPNTAIAFQDASLDGLAARRNLISELYKYPSLVDEYFNHKHEE